MLRFQKFTGARSACDEFGHIEKEDEFKSLLAYSPYHNIKAGTHFPSTLIMTADTDDRVVPMHSFKFAAAMQRAQAGDGPVLLHVETRAGHGSGMTVKRGLEVAADRLAFLVKELRMEVAKEQ
jgi:prolyl oligopeptidase